MTDSGSETSDGPAPHRDQSASELLRSLSADTASAWAIGNVAAAAGSKAHGIAIFLMALPEAVPLPLPSASAVLGIPLVVISAHLAVFGENNRLPSRVEAFEIPRPVIVGMARYVGPLLNWLEHVSHPRMLWASRYPRLIGILCLYLSLILLAPIPFVNLLPALCLVALSLGMMQRDGLFILAGALGTVLTTAALFGIVDLARFLLTR